MSHIRTGKLNIKSVELFAECIDNLLQTFLENNPNNKLNIQNKHVEILKNTRPRYFHGHGELCDYVISIPGSQYDLGLKQNDIDDTYTFIADEELFQDSPYWQNSARFFAGHFLGKDLRNALEKYQIAIIEEEAYSRGYSVTFHENELGELIGVATISDQNNYLTY